MWHLKHVSSTSIFLINGTAGAKLAIHNISQVYCDAVTVAEMAGL